MAEKKKIKKNISKKNNCNSSELENDSLEDTNNKHNSDIVKEVFTKLGNKLFIFIKKVFHVVRVHLKLIAFVGVVLITLINVTNHLIGGKVMKDYKDYPSYQIKYSQILNKQDTYYVYFYSTDCSHCQELKRYIFQYLDSNKNNKTDGIPLYIFCVDDFLEELTSESGTENILGVTDIKELKLVGTPTMILIGNHEIKNAWASTAKIKSQLKT